MFLRKRSRPPTHRPQVIPAAAPARTGDPAAIPNHNRAHGLTIDASTPIPDWDGTPPDYDAAAAHLHDTTYPTHT